MDWARAKTILIIIFLALNLFLFYNVTVQESKTIEISQNQVSDVKAILASNNIDLKAELPNKVKAKSFLQIEDYGFNEKDALAKYLGSSDGVLKSENSGILIYMKASKSLGIYPDKKVMYKDSAPSENVEWTKSGAQKYAEGFLKDHGVNLKYGVISKISETKEGFELKYLQEFKGFMIFGSYINVKVSKKGVTEAEMSWLNPIGFTDTPKEIKSPLEILLLFAKERGNKEKISVNNVSLGYYLPLEEFKNASVFAVPVWKIETSAGEVFYYNAYEGYLENKVAN